MKKIFIIAIALFLSACSQTAENENLTPNDTYRAYSRAVKKKDINAVKQTFSKNTLQMMESTAKEQKISLDDAVKNQIELSAANENPEIRNEKIEGESALIEVKNSFGGWDRIPFAQEDKRWKIALDRLMEEFQKEIDESNKKLDEEINKGKK